MIKTWRNGAKGEEVKAIIDYNFKAISEALNKYTRDIYTSDWTDNNITILYENHRVENPNVQLFIKDSGSFAPVSGGVKIDSEHNIILSTDLPFDGRIVVK